MLGVVCVWVSHDGFSRPAMLSFGEGIFNRVDGRRCLCAGEMGLVVWLSPSSVRSFDLSWFNIRIVRFGVFDFW